MTVTGCRQISTTQSWSSSTITESKRPPNSGNLTTRKRYAIAGSRSPLDVMLKFFKITKESTGEDEKSSGMTTEGFKDNFEKAFFEVISEKEIWFERVDGSRDPAN